MLTTDGDAPLFVRSPHMPLASIGKIDKMRSRSEFGADEYFVPPDFAQV